MFLTSSCFQVPFASRIFSIPLSSFYIYSWNRLHFLQATKCWILFLPPICMFSLVNSVHRSIEWWLILKRMLLSVYSYFFHFIYFFIVLIPHFVFSPESSFSISWHDGLVDVNFLRFSLSNKVFILSHKGKNNFAGINLGLHVLSECFKNFIPLSSCQYSFFRKGQC